MGHGEAYLQRYHAAGDILRQTWHFEDSLGSQRHGWGEKLEASEQDHEQKGYDNGCNEDG